MTAAAPAPAAPNSQSCFWVRHVDNFASIDPHTVYVRTAGRQVFELKLFGPCLDVDWSHRIGLRARGSSMICEGRANSAEVIVRSTGHSPRCPVDSVRRLTAEEVAALPKGAQP